MHRYVRETQHRKSGLRQLKPPAVACIAEFQNLQPRSREKLDGVPQLSQFLLLFSAADTVQANRAKISDVQYHAHIVQKQKNRTDALINCPRGPASF
mmetsp:Transcript_15127/g.40929  ORF Transcript_15127/g.40929 Transcript_15127/m.40929 type:complete len:97 (-) Transcript_15127:989-1279(-)